MPEIVVLLFYVNNANSVQKLRTKMLGANPLLRCLSVQCKNNHISSDFSFAVFNFIFHVRFSAPKLKVYICIYTYKYKTEGTI